MRVVNYYRGIMLSENCQLYNKDKRCDSLDERVRKSLDDFIELLNLNNHKLISEFHNTSTKVLIDFGCVHDYHWITPSKYKQGQGCPQCANKIRNENKSKRAKEEFIDLISQNGHVLLSDYIKASEKVLIDYKCGHSPHLVTPNNYRKEEGSGCPKCSGKSCSQAKEDLLKLIEENEHVILSEYVNAHTKVLIDFKCGHEPRWITPAKYKLGRGCWICSESKGEKKIRKWLDDNDVKFESQKIYDGLLGVGGGNLSYDFYIPLQNMLIEYQGEFHDGKANDYVKENLEVQKEHDRRKINYAKLNNIYLLEIWYWDFDKIEEILKEKIK